MPEAPAQLQSTTSGSIHIEFPGRAPFASTFCCNCFMMAATTGSIRAAVNAIRDRIVHVIEETKQVLERGLAGFGAKFQEWKRQREQQAQEQKLEIERQQKVWNEQAPQLRRSGPRRSGPGDHGMEIGD